MLNILAVFTGGGTGAICRYLATKLSAKYIGSCIWGTLSVNILTSPFLSSFLGGLTTFSTFSMEAFGFLKDGKILNAIFYLSASVVLGLAATYGGYLLGK